MCENKVSQFVPRGFDYKEVFTPCGSTGIHGQRLLCEQCANDENLAEELKRHDENMAADNAWLASAGWGEM